MNAPNNRILIVDDNRGIHEDFHKILRASPDEARLEVTEAALFDQPAARRPEFALTSAFQGEQALDLVRRAQAAGEPFALAFVDVRMPPGIDGVETAQRLWAIDPELQIVICSAYSDYGWRDMTAQFGAAERWVLLKKPFDNIEVLQLASAFTEKWALRQQVRAHLAELEQRVRARTAELENALERLRADAAERARAQEERRLLERKLEETQRLEGLGVLAGGIAHDFNNILTGVLMSASLARLDVHNPLAVAEHLRRIEDNSRRAAALCEHMLAYAGKGRVQLAALDLNALVRDTLELLQPALLKDVDLALELGAGPLPLRGDAARLRQVLMNLLTNAAEALIEPPRRIRLQSGRVRLDAAALQRLAHRGEAQPGEFVQIEISDTGSGMSAETLARIFEPFFTTKFTGRGLGLCAVLGIIRSHGGALDVASVPGQGTTFRACFPLAAETPASVPPARPPARRGSGRVLVIDDEESVRAVAAATLANHGYEPVAAADGQSALELARHSPRDFVGVLIDLTMPGLDGAATLLALRQFLPGIPAAVMTGHSRGDAVERLRGHEGVTFLQKPFEIAGLLEAVAAFQRRGGQAAPAVIGQNAALAPLAPDGLSLSCGK
jgi:signal transduction histidine kinase